MGDRRTNNQIQDVRNLAFQNLMAETSEANWNAAKKAAKEKKIRTIVIVFSIVTLIAVFIVIQSFKNEHNGQLRNFATESMSADYTNVYADVVSIEPEYHIGVGFKGSSSSTTMEIVCKCKTVEGKTIWAAIRVDQYPNGDLWNPERNTEQHYDKVHPMRLKGQVATAEEVADGLEYSIGDTFVLRTRSLQKQ